MKDLGDKEASFLPPLEKGAREKSLQPNTRSCGGDHPPIEIQATLPDSEGSFLPLEQGVKENWGGRGIDSLWGHQSGAQAAGSRGYRKGAKQLGTVSSNLNFQSPTLIPAHSHTSILLLGGTERPFH